MRRALLAAALSLWAGSGLAQGFGISLGSSPDPRLWEAVGRLEIAGDAFCTGALISADLVLTAAHCLYDAETGKPVPLEEMQFLAGWRNGRPTAYRYVRQAEHLPDYVYRGAPGAQRVRTDIALLRLQHPIRNTSVMPFETAARPGVGAEIGVVSYAHDRSNAPTVQEMCHVLAQQDGVLIMSCEVDFGSSGSPVFSFADGTPRIVSVVSGKAAHEGQSVSLGTDLLEPLQRLRTQMDGSSKRLTTAKFVRP